MESSVDADGDLAAALEESLREFQAQQAKNSMLLPRTGANSGAPVDRSVGLQPPEPFHFGQTTEGSPVQPQPGYYIQRGATNQFHSDFNPLVTKHDAASSICGYLTVANLKLMNRVVLPNKREDGILTLQDIDRLIGATRNVRNVMDCVEDAMKRISADRRAYVDSNPGLFDGERSAKRYIEAWVANYEISRLLREEGEGNVFFLRYNQFIQLKIAMHEEKEIIEKEERRFGGSVVDDGVARFTDGDSMFWIEQYQPERKLQTPEEWMKEEEEEEKESSPPLKLFALDLNGHFTACIACKTEELGNTLVLVNTTEIDYAQSKSFSWLFDLCFPPTRKQK